MEVDRSSNTNDYFSKDRPAYLYKSELIDLDNLKTEYELDLVGWMCNATVGNIGSSYDQSPDLTNSAFDASFKSTYFSTAADAKYIWVPEPQFLIDTDANYDDMIFNITVTISE